MRLLLSNTFFVTCNSSYWVITLDSELRPFCGALWVRVAVESKFQPSRVGIKPCTSTSAELSQNLESCPWRFHYFEFLWFSTSVPLQYNYSAILILPLLPCPCSGLFLCGISAWTSRKSCWSLGQSFMIHYVWPWLKAFTGSLSLAFSCQIYFLKVLQNLIDSGQECKKDKQSRPLQSVTLRQFWWDRHRQTSRLPLLTTWVLKEEGECLWWTEGCWHIRLIMVQAWFQVTLDWW